MSLSKSETEERRFPAPKAFGVGKAPLLVRISDRWGSVQVYWAADLAIAPR
jgi:hypothetical protein